MWVMFSVSLYFIFAFYNLWARRPITLMGNNWTLVSQIISANDIIVQINPLPINNTGMLKLRENERERF